MSIRAQIILCWVAVILLFTALYVGQCHAANGPSTNATVTVYDQDGHAVEIPVPDSLKAIASRYGGLIACITTLAGLVLKFVPKPQPGSWESFLVWILKFVKVSTPEKHMEDVPLKPTAAQPPPEKPPEQNFHG